MLLELQNGCEDQRTLDLYNKFIYSPHCITGVMYPVYDDEGIIENEFIEVTFTHYADIVTVVFKVHTGGDTVIGEVFLHVTGTIDNGVEENNSEKTTE